MADVVVKKKKIYSQKYTQFHTRLESYNEIPHDSFLYKRRKVFAEAGFFHTGKNDETICYYCGGGLKDWDDIDDPWIEHARWFEKCPFVLVIKGQGFVNKHRNLALYRSLEEGVKVIVCTPEEKKQEVSGRECIICSSSETNLLFLPCRHCCTCTSCGLMYNNCPVCRAAITSLMKIFIV